ncbi:MAG: PilN domain-containing protein [Actinomycetota bacterium]
MKYIDLLPRKEREFNKRTVALNIVIVLLVIFLGLMAASVILINDMNSNLVSSLEKHQEVGDRLKDYVDRLEVYRNFEQKVESKEDLIALLADRAILWSDMLFSLGETMPEDTYLINYEGSFNDLQDYIEDYSPETRDRRVNSFTIRGHAKQYLDVSKLLINLRKIPYVGDAWVRNMSSSQITESLTGISFYVEAFWDTEKIVEEWEIEEKKDEPVQEEMEDIIGQ